MTTVLVIEDEPVARQYLVEILEQVRYEVLPARDGAQGLRLAFQHLPQIIACDIMLSDMDGYQVLEAIRQNAQTKTVPFIFLTAKSARADQRKAMEMGADDYITKPFSKGELLIALETQLKKQSGVSEKYESTLRLLRKNIIYALPHEIRTPLSHVLGFAEMLQDDGASYSAEQITSIASTILKSGRRLQRMFENYLVYAQIELIANDPAARQSINSSLMRDPAEVIQQEASKVAELYNRQADLFLDLNNAGIRMSRVDLEKVVYELLDNAFKFSEPGTQVTLVSSRAPGRFIVSIEDHGRGMSPEQLQDIGAYMQFGRALYEQQGLGLGLVIAKSLVELHEGTFEIHSEPSTGTFVQLAFQA